MIWFILGSFLCIGFILAVRMGVLVWHIRHKRASFAWPPRDTTTKSSTQPATPKKTLIVLGSGGHTSEMIQLIRNLDAAEFYPLQFVKAATDTTSVQRLHAAGIHTTQAVVVHEIPRAREVGQSYVSSIYSTLHAFVYALQLMVIVRPDVLLCNGPGTCLPLCVAALLWRIVGLAAATRIIFVESYCRVETMSLTGRLLYQWVDLCCVHWPNLQTKYPLTTCISTMIRHDKKKQ